MREIFRPRSKRETFLNVVRTATSLAVIAGSAAVPSLRADNSSVIPAPAGFPVNFCPPNSDLWSQYVGGDVNWSLTRVEAGMIAVYDGQPAELKIPWFATAETEDGKKFEGSSHGIVYKDKVETVLEENIPVTVNCIVPPPQPISPDQYLPCLTGKQICV